MVATLLHLHEVWIVLGVLVLIGLVAALPEYPTYIASRPSADERKARRWFV